jgi:hypothetical protein
MIAAWPGIGNIGLIAVDTLRQTLHAESFAEIEPWRFFFPHGIVVEKGELTDLHFPRCRFFHTRIGQRDLIFFTGEEQPANDRKSYEMASLILDLCALLGCKRIYTAAAAVTGIHHTAKPRVWAVPNSEDLFPEIKQYPNTVLLSDLEDKGNGGNITGLNGLLLGVARSRGIRGICLLGEIPVYVSGLLTPYPKASRSILEVFGHILGIAPDLGRLDALEQEVDQNIAQFYDLLPAEMRARLDQLRPRSASGETPGGITEDDKRKILQDIEEYFKKGGKGD